MSGRRTYTQTERDKALDLVEAKGIAAASRTLGIPQPTLRKWRQKYRACTTRAAVDPARHGDGRWKSGYSGNPEGRSKAQAAAEALAAEASPEVVDEYIHLFQQLRDDDADVRALANAKLEAGGKIPHLLAVGDRILDRGLGRPKARNELTGADGGPLEISSVGDLLKDVYGVQPGQGPDLDADLEAAAAEGDEGEEGDDAG